jgi:hypothetical protein
MYFSDPLTSALKNPTEFTSSDKRYIEQKMKATKDEIDNTYPTPSTTSSNILNLDINGSSEDTIDRSNPITYLMRRYRNSVFKNVSELDPKEYYVKVIGYYNQYEKQAYTVYIRLPLIILSKSENIFLEDFKKCFDWRFSDIYTEVNGDFVRNIDPKGEGLIANLRSKKNNYYDSTIEMSEKLPTREPGSGGKRKSKRRKTLVKRKTNKKRKIQSKRRRR